MNRPAVKNLKSELMGTPHSDLLRFAKTTQLVEDNDIDGNDFNLDSYEQIQILLEGLYHLGKLQEAMNVITQLLITLTTF